MYLWCQLYSSVTDNFHQILTKLEYIRVIYPFFMFKSLFSRGLAAGLVIFVVVFLLAYSGQSLLQQSMHSSNVNGLKINQLLNVIDEIKKPIHGIEAGLYQFLLSLEDTDKYPVFDHISALETLTLDLQTQSLINENPLLQIQFKKFNQGQQQLTVQARQLLDLNFQQRFPSMRLVFEQVNPTLDAFNAHIQIIEDLLQQSEPSDSLASAVPMINQIKYIWSQSLSNTRLMISTRIGIFGNPSESIEYLNSNNQSYRAELEKLLSQLALMDQLNDTDLVFADSLEKLGQAVSQRFDTLEQIKKGLSLSDWRRDKYIMITELEPILQRLNSHLHQLELATVNLSQLNLTDSQYATTQLSNFLWLSMFLVMALILTAYLVFEHWIRRPIKQVARAMSSEAVESTATPLKRVGAIEIDNLIDTFESMQTEIRMRQQRLTSVLQNAGEGIIVSNNEHQIDSFNVAAERIFQKSAKQVVGQSIMDLIDPHNTEMFDRIVKDLNDPEINNQQYLCSGLRPDGENFALDLTISNMQLEQKLFNILVMRDATERIANEYDLNQARLNAEAMQEKLAEQVIQLDASLSELKQTQKQLVESEKMASLAGLVAGVAHEINTPVGISVTAASHMHVELNQINQQFKAGTLSAEMMQEYLEDAKSAINIIQNNLNQAATLIRSFKQVAVDQSSEEIRHFNLKEYLDEIVLNLKPKLKQTQHHIAVEVDEDIQLTTVAGALAQIITNLIMNSLMHAFDQKTSGTMKISAELEDQVLLLVYQDDGRGMNPETQKNIFEPFYTTKRGSGGSGLGMHITYNLVTSTLKGHIECISSEGQGAQFVISIPPFI